MTDGFQLEGNLNGRRLLWLVVQRHWSIFFCHLRWLLLPLLLFSIPPNNMLATRMTEGAPKKSKHEKKPIVDLKEPSSKSTLKTKKPPPTPRETVQSSSPEPEVPSDFGHITDDDDDDDDSSDEEDNIVDIPDIPELGTLKLHTFLKDDATVKRKIERAKRQPVISFSFHIF